MQKLHKIQFSKNYLLIDKHFSENIFTEKYFQI